MTLIELMLVVAIIGLLASLATVEFRLHIMRVRRTEAVMGLSTIWTSQRARFVESGTYASAFSQLEFDVTGGQQLASNVYRGRRYTYQLTQPWGSEGFYCIATGQLDGDPWPDILEIYALPGE